jgi:hypothetical protein
LLVNVRDLRTVRVVQRKLESRNVGLGSFAKTSLLIIQMAEGLKGTYEDLL